MDQKELREWEARCTQEEPPACQAGCPLGLDVRGFNKALASGGLDEGRRFLDKSLPLTEIVARLCEGPCKKYCLRSKLGGSIEIPKLEKFCIERTSPKIKIIPLPVRPKKVAVIGSGPSSLTVAFELGRKGYPVTLFCLQDRFGAWLCSLDDCLLPKEVLNNQKEVLAKLKVRFVEQEVLNESILAQDFDSFFIGQDDVVAQELLNEVSNIDPVSLALHRDGYFSTFKIDGADRFIEAVSQGRQAAISMDRYMQGASLHASRVLLRHGETDLFVNTSDINNAPPVVCQNGYYDAEGATKEAKRCIGCECLECVKKCTFLQEFGAYPKVYVRRIYNNSAIVMGNHQANTFINSCTLCGQCEEICPNNFSMAKVCLEARQMMVEEQRMPPSAGAFAISEMYSAKSEAYLLSHAKNSRKSTAIFFPGCQLSGLRPEQTKELYLQLQKINPATGIWLDCCAVPAHWHGDNEVFSMFIDESRQRWQEMGAPQVITACTSCTEIFREHIPDMVVVPVWHVLKKHGVAKLETEQTFAISDPCTARYNSETKDSVRDLVAQLGQNVEELPASGKLTECCGFGGLMESTNRNVSEKVVEDRMCQTDRPVLTYCAMCSDQLAKSGKPVYHMFDLLFPIADRVEKTHPVSISTRRENRRMLQQELLTYTGSSTVIERPKWHQLKLEIPSDVAQRLNDRRILEDDIKHTLYLSLHQNNREYVCHASSSKCIAHQCIGKVTYWVQYHMVDDVYHVESCWSHRMSIKEVSYES